MNELTRFCPALKAVKVLGSRATRRALLCELISVFNAAGEEAARQPAETAGGEERERSVAEEEGEEDAEAKELRDSLARIRAGGVSVVVTSYEMLLLESRLFSRIAFYYVVVDEAHRLKNDTSKLTAAVRSCRTKFRLLLTGTPLQVSPSFVLNTKHKPTNTKQTEPFRRSCREPLGSETSSSCISSQNNLHELWALLNLLLPSLFDSSDDFAALFDFAAASPAGEAATNEEIDKVNSQIASRIHRILRPFMLRCDGRPRWQRLQIHSACLLAS